MHPNFNLKGGVSFYFNSYIITDKNYIIHTSFRKIILILHDSDMRVDREINEGDVEFFLYRIW